MDANESDREPLGETGLVGAVQSMMNTHWVDEGYCAPNLDTYPHQWLWDSCFHSLIWAELGDERAVIELETALGTQSPDGFVPHMNYVRAPEVHASLWGRDGASSITQPPMYGHAVAELTRRGFELPEQVVERARNGLRFLLFDRRRSASGLVELCHPWESGADDSPRWDDLCPGGFEIGRWRAEKSDLVGSVSRNEHGSPIHNDRFPVASVGFNALVAFNTIELTRVAADDTLLSAAVELVDRLVSRWSPELATWVDDGAHVDGSGRFRCLDGLLPLLVERDPERTAAVERQLMDVSQHGGACGPSGVHRAEPTYAPDRYWRGPAWPQLSYLVFVGLQRAGADVAAAAVAASTRKGARRSGLAEYWHPDTGAGFGAIPQCWAGLAILMPED